MWQCFKPCVWMHKGKPTFSERSHRSEGVFFSEPLLDWALKILGGRENNTSTRRQKIFCNPTTPDNNQNETAFVGFMGDRRRQVMVYRDARFMLVPVICVCCRGVERRS